MAEQTQNLTNFVRRGLCAAALLSLASLCQAQTLQLPATATTWSSGDSTAWAASSITASGPANATLTINHTAHITFVAGTQISLEPGFTASTNADSTGITFHAAIGTVPPDFTVSIAPITATVVAGASASYTVTVTPVNGFVGTVTFQLQSPGWPAGVYASFSPSSITTSGSTTMTVSTTAGGTTGNFPFTVMGTNVGIGGTLQHQSLSATLVIQDFTLVLSPSEQTVAPGGTAPLTVSVIGVNGFAQLVYLAGIDGFGFPANPVAPFTLSPGGSGSIAIQPTGGAGSTATVLAHYTGGGVPHVASATITVRNGYDFSIQTITASQPVTLPGNAIYGLNVNSVGNFTGQVTLMVTGMPSGVNCSQPTVSAGSPATIQCSVPAGVAAQTYLLTITGTATIGSRTATVSLVIPAAPDFSISSAESSQTVAPAGSAIYHLSVNPVGGFNGTVALTASGLPTGATASFNPTSTTASSILTVTTTSATPSGTSIIAITGQSGSSSHTTTVSLTVGSPTFTISTPQTLPAGTVGTAYSQTLGGASGGTPSYTWAVKAGSSLPAGLTLSQLGTLSGTPTTPTQGSSSFTVVVTDSALHTAEGVFSLTITAQAVGPTFTISGIVRNGSAALPGVTVTLSGQAVPVTSDSTGAYSFSVPAGTYTVTPSSGTYTFCPAFATWTNLSASQTANFSTGVPAKEYVRLGSRVIAVVNCGGQ